MKLKHFENVAAVVAYIGSELVATLNDDANSLGRGDADTKRELRAKVADIEAVMPTLHHLDDREHATVLAALRCYQETVAQSDEPMPERFNDLATNGGKLNALDADAIDALCERLNCGG